MTKHHFSLASMIDEVLGTHAARPALRYAEGEHTFGELSDWVDALTEYLLCKELKCGDVIAIAHDKRPLSYALMLAALRLGIVYVNVDVASPKARTRLILNTCGAILHFYDNPAYETEMRDLAPDPILLDTSMLPTPENINREHQRMLSCMIDGATIAYIMFTSGSTGTPKGVAVTHQNVLHLIAWGQARFDVTEYDNFANISPMYFDNSVFDFYVGLFAGACLTPVDRSLLTRPYELVAHVDACACTVWFSVPSALIFLMAMKAFVPGALPNLRAIVFGGEGYPKVELKKLYDRFLGQAELINVYGPTECTCICSAHNLTEFDFTNLEGLPTLGRLNPNFDHRILDEDDCDAAEGELCLIGPNIAAGYFNDLERTQLAFHTLTEPNRFMKRMYRTGDLVRKINEHLYFVGRKDNQIKHMGYRIELEEIEHALIQLPEVNQAAVVYQRSQIAYGKLVAFVACTTPAEDKALTLALRDLLPDYMIPARLIVLPSLPTNANGKVDRQGLRAELEP